MSETVTVTDYDECQVAEGLELHVQGRGFKPYPATPGPAPRPAEGREDGQ